MLQHIQSRTSRNIAGTKSQVKRLCFEVKTQKVTMTKTADVCPEGKLSVRSISTPSTKRN
nr:hypothetical protein [Solitalea koreensis]